MIARGAPEVYEYTIKRDGNGDPARTPGGEVAIEFGPADHTDATGWPRPGIRWTLVRSIPRLLGLPPFF